MLYFEDISVFDSDFSIWLHRLQECSYVFLLYWLATESNLVFVCLCCHPVSWFGNKERSGGISGAYISVLSSAQHHQQSEGRCTEHQWRTHSVWGQCSVHSDISVAVKVLDLEEREGPLLAIALLTWIRLVTRSASQSQKCAVWFSWANDITLHCPRQRTIGAVVCS